MLTGALALMLGFVATADVPGASVDTAGWRRLLVLPLESAAGVPAGEVRVLSDLMSNEAKRIPRHKVVSQQDIEQMLSLEARQQLAGCDTTGCLAELGGALDADEVLFGSVGRLGADELVITLGRIDPRTSQPLPGGAERITGTSTDAALDAVPRLLQRLYPKYVPPEPRVGPPRLAVVAPVMFLVGAAVQYAMFSSMFTSLLFLPCPVLGLTCGCASLSGCASSPVVGSFLQAWVGDLVGRRQMGVRRGILAGVLAGAAVAVGTLFTLLLMVPGGFVVALALPTQVSSQRAGVEAMIRLFIPFQDTRVNFMVLGAAISIWAGVLALVTIVPFAQLVGLLSSSRVRSPDVEAVAPGLWAPHEGSPGCVSWMPCRVIGGRKQASSTGVLEPAPHEKAPTREPPTPTPAPAQESAR